MGDLTKAFPLFNECNAFIADLEIGCCTHLCGYQKHSAKQQNGSNDATNQSVSHERFAPFGTKYAIIIADRKDFFKSKNGNITICNRIWVEKVC
jgi:hypothetical protein